jgi:hypothetical protein
MTPMQPDEPHMVQVSATELDQLRQDSRKLTALETVGVDNWSGYERAMEILHEGEDF